MYGAIGFVALPMDWINAFINHPKLLAVRRARVRAAPDAVWW